MVNLINFKSTNNIFLEIYIKTYFENFSYILEFLCVSLTDGHRTILAEYFIVEGFQSYRG